MVDHQTFEPRTEEPSHPAPSLTEGSPSDLEPITARDEVKSAIELCSEGILRVPHAFGGFPHASDIAEAMVGHAHNLGQIASIKDFRFKRPCPSNVMIEIAGDAHLDKLSPRPLCTARLVNATGARFLFNVIPDPATANTALGLNPVSELAFKRKLIWIGKVQQYKATFPVPRHMSCVRFVLGALGHVTLAALRHCTEYMREEDKLSNPLHVVTRYSDLDLESLDRSREVTVSGELLTIERQKGRRYFTVHYEVSDNCGYEFTGEVQRTVVDGDEFVDRAIG